MHTHEPIQTNSCKFGIIEIPVGWKRQKKNNKTTNGWCLQADRFLSYIQGAKVFHNCCYLQSKNRQAGFLEYALSNDIAKSAEGCLYSGEGGTNMKKCPVLSGYVLCVRSSNDTKRWIIWDHFGSCRPHLIAWRWFFNLCRRDRKIRLWCRHFENNIFLQTVNRL